MKSEVYMAARRAGLWVVPIRPGRRSRAAALRRLWSAWGCDPDNPFRQWLSPGGTAVIKPNWVMDYNPLGHSIESLVTHTSLIRHMIYACAAAMQGTGTIIIGDSPLQGCNFAALLRLSRMNELLETGEAAISRLEDRGAGLAFDGAAATGQDDRLSRLAAGGQG